RRIDWRERERGERLAAEEAWRALLEACAVRSDHQREAFAEHRDRAVCSLRDHADRTGILRRRGDDRVERERRRRRARPLGERARALAGRLQAHGATRALDQPLVFLAELALRDRGRAVAP